MSEMRIDRAAMHRRAQAAEAEVERLRGELAEWKRLCTWWREAGMRYRRELETERNARRGQFSLRRVTDG